MGKRVWRLCTETSVFVKSPPFRQEFQTANEIIENSIFSLLSSFRWLADLIILNEDLGKSPDGYSIGFQLGTRLNDGD